MRLTLRTMLAYLDEILEPEDSQDIGHKIEESEFASGLVHRTRDCMRRLRLGVPAVVGRGMAHDPNSVAEYLDNTLAAEKVPEFEKVCLESDVHLAEVASCHQILTLVLGEPADVDPDSRERMYQLIHQPEKVAAPPVAGASVAGASAAVAVGAVSAPPVHTEVTVVKRAKPEVPDYLREKRSRFWPIVATLLVAALITGGTLAVLSKVGPPGFREWANKMLASNSSQDKPDGDDASAGGDGDENKEPADNQSEKQDGVDDLNGGKVGDAPGDAKFPTLPGALDVPTRRDGDDANPDDLGPSKVGTSRADVKFPTTQRTNPNDEMDEPAPEPGEASLGNPQIAGADADHPDEMAVDTSEADDPARAQPGKIDLSAAPVEPDPGAPLSTAQDLGRYLSEQDVLLLHDPKSDGWQRLKPRAPLVAGDKLLSLPAFRSSITLGSGLTIQTVGPTLVELLPLDDNGVPGISVAYGRVIMLTLGKAGNKIRLQLGEKQGLLTFVDPDATLAVEVHRVLVPGRDPESAPALWGAELFVQSGKVTWQSDDAPLELQGPGRASLTELSVSDTPPGEFAKWIATDGLTDLERRGALVLNHDLTTDRAISLSLKELSESRQKEVRSLAIRSLAYVGKFEPFITALNDPDQRLNWPGQIETLKASLARGPDVAAQVRGAFEKQRGGEGLALYRMLWGYSAEDLKKGSDAQLVEYLSSKSLDFRVLSSWNLQAITGLPGFYRPDYAEAKRKPQALKWKQKLDEGKITPMAAAPPKPAGKGASK